MVPASILGREVGTGLGIYLSATRAPELSSTELPASTTASTPLNLPHNRNLSDLYALFDPGGLQIIVPKPNPTASIPHSLTVILCPRSTRLHYVSQQLRQRFGDILTTGPYLSGRIRTRGGQAGLCRRRYC